ncbi:hypothetical protein COUCH_05480 [Couchioplanes caeruleus]|uniref:hypothetical protein n=1 Tax=Couchioplanes caeruleus TaxID=56438 RepID=UPI0020BEBBA7|nr:hypothetical protein [Couchioplanes caeruleus]UQU65771.1 hypothetical protein COUCH_05480 [Couchioplanes caeruleus]
MLSVSIPGKTATAQRRSTDGDLSSTQTQAPADPVELSDPYPGVLLQRIRQPLARAAIARRIHAPEAGILDRVLIVELQLFRYEPRSTKDAIERSPGRTRNASTEQEPYRDYDHTHPSNRPTHFLHQVFQGFQH